MTAQPEALTLAEQWLAKANDDLLAAQHLLTDTDSWAFGSVCYHAQQCAEKAIEAVLCASGVYFSENARHH